VDIGESAPLGAIVLAQAEIGEAGVGTNATRATAATRVESGVPVQISIDINPDPVGQGMLLAVAFDVMSLAPVSSSLALSVRVPSQVLFFAAASTGGGSCGSVNCVPSQIVTWQFPAVAPNGEVFVQIPPTVAPAAQVPDGTVIPFESLLTEASGRWRRLRRSVLVE
jgi:hypothetical protein